MDRTFRIIQLIVLNFLFASFSNQNQETYDLTINVNALRNSTGSVVFALYNREDAFPDEHYKKYLRKMTGEIVNRSSTVTFENLPAGRYAVNILHDENQDGRINRGLLMPKEGIGFSNFQSVGFSNRPSFLKASFDLLSDKRVMVKIIYM